MLGRNSKPVQPSPNLDAPNNSYRSQPNDTQQVEPSMRSQIEQHNKTQQQQQNNTAEAHKKAELIHKMKQFAGDHHISNFISQDLKESLAYKHKLPAKPFSGVGRENNQIIEFDKKTFSGVEQRKPQTRAAKNAYIKSETNKYMNKVQNLPRIPEYDQIGRYTKQNYGLEPLQQVV